MLLRVTRLTRGQWSVCGVEWRGVTCDAYCNVTEHECRTTSTLGSEGRWDRRLVSSRREPHVLGGRRKGADEHRASFSVPVPPSVHCLRHNSPPVALFARVFLRCVCTQPASCARCKRGSLSGISAQCCVGVVAGTERLEVRVAA